MANISKYLKQNFKTIHILKQMGNFDSKQSINTGSNVNKGLTSSEPIILDDNFSKLLLFI